MMEQQAFDLAVGILADNGIAAHMSVNTIKSLLLHHQSLLDHTLYTCAACCMCTFDVDLRVCQVTSSKSRKRRDRAPTFLKRQYASALSFWRPC